MLRHLPDNPDIPGIPGIPDSKDAEDVSFLIHMVIFLYNAEPPPRVPSSESRTTQGFEDGYSIKVSWPSAPDASLGARNSHASPDGRKYKKGGLYNFFARHRPESRCPDSRTTYSLEDS